ncbi:hypothetical protein ACVJGC_005476 [Bradyrhizobium diazoefficiens]
MRRENIRELLQSVSHVERTAMLITSIVEREPEAFAAAQAIVRLVGALTGGLSGFYRYKVAEQMIELAMQMKARQVEVDAKD